MAEPDILRPHAEFQYAAELEALAAVDTRERLADSGDPSCFRRARRRTIDDFQSQRIAQQ